MSFLSGLKTSRLPEKPWRLGPVVRLVVGVIISIMMGAVAAMVIRYFETPQKSSAPAFLALAILALVLLLGAIVMLFRPWTVEERYLSRLIGLLSLIYGGILCIWLAGRLIEGKEDLQNPVIAMLIALLFFQGMALVLVHFFLRQHFTSWREGFGLDLEPGQTVVIGVCAGILTLFPAWMLQGLSMDLFEKLTLHPHEQQAVEILRHAESLLSRAALGFATILVAPMGEEVIFRGILYPALKRRFSQQVALWSTAILFGAIHANLATLIPLTFLAVVLVLLYEYTGNLLAPIAVHCVFNAANFIALYSQQN
jgi:uncharacterized protein